MLMISGWRSKIAQELRVKIESTDVAERMQPAAGKVPLDAERYFFCQGLLRPKRLEEQSSEEVLEAMEVNCNSVVRACDAIIEANDKARICVMGSESGYRGSFDGAYAAAKKRLHEYVERKRLRTPWQQLVAVSPSIIADAGMTLRRQDQKVLDARRAAHPKIRFLTSFEVATVVHFLLYGTTTYLTGTIIRMHGGEL